MEWGLTIREYSLLRKRETILSIVDNLRRMESEYETKIDKMKKLFEIDLTDSSGATFSYDRKYRYRLWRFWDKNKPPVAFIGLNPSTANEDEPDPTIRRVIQFAKDWGYGGVYMFNLFAIVSSSPEVLLTCKDSIKENGIYLQELSESGMDIVFAWGSFKEADKRANEVKAIFPSATCLGINIKH